MPKLMCVGQAAKRPRTCFCDSGNASAQGNRVRLGGGPSLACFGPAIVAKMSVCDVGAFWKGVKGGWYVGGELGSEKEVRKRMLFSEVKLLAGHQVSGRWNY